MAISLITPDPEADAERRRRLRTMRTLALGLLLLAAVVFVLTLGRSGVWGFVNAGAEAAMVGAMADWFAVTALFRHPLGLPIPHTALIPRRKDELGRGLEDFMRDNFLQESVIRERLDQAQVITRLATWVTVPANASRVVREVATLGGIGLRKVREEDVAEVVREVIVPKLIEEPISPIAGAALAEIVADKAHHNAVDLILDEAHRWLVHNQETFTEVLGERAPWWAPPKLNDTITQRLHLEAIRWVSDIRSDPDHHARHAVDSMLAQLADDLLHNEATQQRAERLKNRLLEHPQLIATGLSLWNALRGALIEALDDVDGPLRARAERELVGFAERLLRDDALRTRIQGWLADFAVFAVSRYGSELTAVITATIERWDGKEAAEKIELHVGRDLQFIRINGTIVGGLVGVLIHTVATLIS